eukprot:scaffold45308_cov63-Phaeocystis_antarctica.AAC.2
MRAGEDIVEAADEGRLVLTALRVVCEVGLAPAVRRRVGARHAARKVRQPRVPGGRLGVVLGEGWVHAPAREQQVERVGGLEVPVAAEQARGAARRGGRRGRCTSCCTSWCTGVEAAAALGGGGGQLLEVLHGQGGVHRHELGLHEGAGHVVRAEPRVHLRLRLALQVHRHHGVLLAVRRVVPSEVLRLPLAAVLAAPRARRCLGPGRAGGGSAQPRPQRRKDGLDAAGRLRRCRLGGLALVARDLVREDVRAAGRVGAGPVTLPRLASGRAPLVAAGQVPLGLGLGDAADVHVHDRPRAVREGDADAHVAGAAAAVERVDEGVVALVEEGVQLAAPVPRDLLQKDDGAFVHLQAQLHEDSRQPRLGHEMLRIALGEPAWIR